MEMMYVEKVRGFTGVTTKVQFILHVIFSQLRKRRAVLGLEEGGVVPAPCSDEVLSYKLASVVFQQAIKAIPGKVLLCVW